jgi:hypothetical protein
MSAYARNSSHDFYGALVGRGGRKYSKLARGGLRPITLDRLEALLRDDGRDEEQGTEQQQQ